MSLVENALKKILEKGAADESGRADAIALPVIEPPLKEPTVKLQYVHKQLQIGRADLHGSGLLPPDEDRRRMANEYRRIKRPLIAAAFGRGVEPVMDGRLMMVASALPGEGKTFTTLNLALSLATERDLTVLLVDADLAKPHISSVFGVAEEPGLVSALQDPSINVESLVFETQIPNFQLLPAGRFVDNATELLSSDRMRAVTADLLRMDSSRIVLFDSPPLLLTAESRALTETAGQIVIVVRADMTTRAAVHDAIEAIADGKSVSAILNQSQKPFSESYYGYGQYGSYGADTKLAGNANG